MKVLVRVNEAEAIKLGQEPTRACERVDIDLSALTQAQRDALAATGQRGGGQEGDVLRLSAGVATLEAVAEALDKLALRRAIEAARKAEEAEKQVQSWLAMSQDEFNQTLISSYPPSSEAYRDERLAGKVSVRESYLRAARERRQADAARLKILQERRQADDAAARDKAEAEAAAWIEQHGSSRLQKAQVAGYNAQRLYAQERAALEYPEFVLDFDGEFQAKERVSPSEAALNLEVELKAKGLDAQIVWVTSLGVEDDYERDDDYERFEPCEALIIRGYLGKYGLYKLM